MSSINHQEIFLKDYKPTPFSVKKIDLYFNLNDDYTTIRSNVIYSATAKHNEALKLNGVDLELLEVKIDGKILENHQFHIDHEYLTIPNPPAEFELEVTCKTQPQNNGSLEGLYKSSGNFCTQCEAEGFRKITYYYDRPDVMSKFTTTIEAEKNSYPVLLSNGNCIGKGDLNNGRHWVKWEDPFKKPSYLFALVAGNLSCLKDHYKTMSGKSVSLEIYAIEKDLDKCHHAMESLKNSMRWDEETFGLEYDLDTYMIVAVSDFNMGAMENKGLNVFNTSAVLASETTSVDEDFQWVEGVIGHEYFHNWTGNRVTCRDWFQLCLKEGLTVFRDQEFSSDLGSRVVCRIDAVKTLRSAQFLEDSGPMAHPARPSSFVEINNFYTSTVYNKGAEICRMIHTVLGKEGFRKGMDCYFARHDGQAVTIEDFISAMGDGAGKDIGYFLDWYTQSGTPHVKVDSVYDASEKTFTLKLQQVNPATTDQTNKKTLSLPMTTALIGKDGKNIPLQLKGEHSPVGEERLLTWNSTDIEYQFINVPERPIPSLFRGFSAPIVLEEFLSKSDKIFLMAHDSDPFNRWDISTNLISNEILRLIECKNRSEDLIVDKEILFGFKQILTDHSLDKSYVAIALTPPSEKEIALRMNVIDIEGICVAREALVNAIAIYLENELQETYHSLNVVEKFKVNAESVGKRALKNVCLSYLKSLGKDEYINLITNQFKIATNMTDELTAFNLINRIDISDRKTAIQSFFDKWHNEELVIDYWFEAQASCTLPVGLEEIKQLSEHPTFNIKNPNRVRALLRPFAENLRHFHNINGTGYKLMAEKVIAIDKFNPQLASSLAKIFSIWKKLDSGRKSLVEAELQGIKNSNKLSNDLNEVINKLLKP